MSSLFAVLWERRNEMEKKKPMQLYRKLFWTYTVIVLCIVAALVAYFISASRRRVLLTNESELDWACAAEE